MRSLGHLGFGLHAQFRWFAQQSVHCHKCVLLFSDLGSTFCVSRAREPPTPLQLRLHCCSTHDRRSCFFVTSAYLDVAYLDTRRKCGRAFVLSFFLFMLTILTSILSSMLTILASIPSPILMILHALAFTNMMSRCAGHGKAPRLPQLCQVNSMGLVRLHRRSLLVGCC